jgi:hypothetical protein
LPTDLLGSARHWMIKHAYFLRLRATPFACNAVS